MRRHFCRIAGPVVALALASGLFGQVNLNSATSPAAATVGSTVTVTGTGFPSGTIANTSVTVTITPPQGNGAPVTTLSTGVAAVGSSRIISFKIPTGLVVNSPIIASISVAGTTSTNNAYTTSTPSSITVNPPARVSNISPGAGTLGTSVAVVIAGSYTNFQNTSVITVSGTGVTAVNNGGVAGAATRLLNATFTIAPGTTPGARDVTVKTGTETATITSGFIVAASAGLSFSSIAPNNGQLNQSLDVTVTGLNSHFDATTFANFGDGITVNGPLFAVTAASFKAHLSISPTTYLGWRMVTAVTGGEYAVSTAQGFNVSASPTSVTSISPNTAPQATNLTNVLVTASSNTHFLQNATTLALGSGINVGNIQVTSLNTLTAAVAVGPTATVGPHDVVVTTGGETETLQGGFTVTSSTPFLSAVSPTSAAQGSTATLAVTGVNTLFTSGTVTADFGSNITTSVAVTLVC